MVSYLYLVVYAVVSLATGFFTTSLHLSSWLLQGLHSYLYPENSSGNEHQDIQVGTGSESTKEKEGESGSSGNIAGERSSVNRERVSKFVKETDGDTPSAEITKDCRSSEGFEDGKEVDGQGQPEASKEQTGHPAPRKKENNDVPSPSSFSKTKPRAFLKSLRKRKEKGKDIFEWEEGSSQILRLKVGHTHLHGRHYYQEYDEAIIYSVVGVTNLLVRELLAYASSSESVNASQKGGFLRSDDFAPFLMCLFAAYKVARLLARVGWERSTSRISELTLSLSVGFSGFLIALSLLNFVSASLVDFGFEKLYLDRNKICSSCDGMDPRQQTAFHLLPPLLVKIFIAAVAGWVSGIFIGPAHRSVRSFWLGTDQLQWNIPVIKVGWIANFLLHLNVIIPLLSSILWIRPLGELFIVCKSSGQQFATHQRLEMPTNDGTFTHWQDVPSTALRHGLNSFKEQSFQMQYQYQEKSFPECLEGGQEKGFTRECRQEGKERVFHRAGIVVEHKDGISPLPVPSDGWAQDFCISAKTFQGVCFWSLLMGGLLQIFMFRVNVQTYLNEAVLVWYESLHRSKVMNLELARAKLILNNYFLCRAGLQFLAPGMLVVLFLGMSRVQGNQSFMDTTETLLSGSSFINVLTFFMAWWITFTWALLNCIILTLYRFGFLLAT